jgi:hypothetical protein
MGIKVILRPPLEIQFMFSIRCYISSSGTQVFDSLSVPRRKNALPGNQPQPKNLYITNNWDDMLLYVVIILQNIVDDDAYF